MGGPKDWENPNSPAENSYIIVFARGINLPWTPTPISEEDSEFDLRNSEELGRKWEHVKGASTKGSEVCSRRRCELDSSTE